MKPGSVILFSLSSGDMVLSLCGGSGSLMEAAMHLGRSCMMFEVNGTVRLINLFHVLRRAVYWCKTPNGGAVQEDNRSRRRVKVCVRVFIHPFRYWQNKEPAFWSMYAQAMQVKLHCLIFSSAQLC